MPTLATPSETPLAASNTSNSETYLPSTNAKSSLVRSSPEALVNEFVPLANLTFSSSIVNVEIALSLIFYVSFLTLNEYP